MSKKKPPQQKDAEPSKPAANKSKPPRPVKKQDVKDIDRADAEGMGQPQGLPAESKTPSAVSRGNKSGTARAAKPPPAKPAGDAKKPGRAR